MSTCYHFHMRPTNESELLLDALKEYLGEEIEMHDCVEIVTDREAIAGVVETLFKLEPQVVRELEQPAAEVQPAAEPVLSPTDLEFVNRRMDLASTPDQTVVTPVDFVTIDGPIPEPVKKKRGPYKKRAKAENGNGHKPEEAAQVFAAPAAVDEQPAATEPPAAEEKPAAASGIDPALQAVNLDELIACQSRRWLIASNGKEVDTIDHLISQEKVKPGERIHHRTKGWFDVINDGGMVTIRKAEGAKG